MPVTTLEEAQRLVDRLTPLDQVRLLEYLIPRIARAVASAQSAGPAASDTDANAWRDFFRLGEALAKPDSPGSETMTAAVLSMRR